MARRGRGRGRVRGCSRGRSRSRGRGRGLGRGHGRGRDQPGGRSRRHDVAWMEILQRQSVAIWIMALDLVVVSDLPVV